MKKLFTFIAAALMTVGAMAQKTTILSFTVTSESILAEDEYDDANIIDGGTVLLKGTTVESKVSDYGLKLDSETKYVKVTTTNALQGSDKVNISFFAGSNPSDDTSYGIKVLDKKATDEGVKTLGTKYATTSDKKNTVTYTYTAAGGEQQFYIYRAASSSVYFAKIEITRGEDTPSSETEWNFSNWDDESTGFSNQVKNNLGILACYKNAETQITNFGKINSSTKGSYTKRFQFGGGSAPLESTGIPTQRFVYFNVTGASQITVQAISSSTNTTRTLYISDGTTVISETSCVGTAITECTASYTGGAGVIYIYCSAGINIYDIKATNVGTTELLDDSTKPGTPTAISSVTAPANTNGVIKTVDYM